MREKVDRFCIRCRKQMRRDERIEMGWSVMTGKLAVCSEACRFKWNSKGCGEIWRPKGEENRLREALEQIDRETRSASHVGLLRMGSIARAALRGGGE